MCYQPISISNSESYLRYITIQKINEARENYAYIIYTFTYAVNIHHITVLGMNKSASFWTLSALLKVYLRWAHLEYEQEGVVSIHIFCTHFANQRVLLPLRREICSGSGPLQNGTIIFNKEWSDVSYMRNWKNIKRMKGLKNFHHQILFYACHCWWAIINQERAVQIFYWSWEHA